MEWIEKQKYPIRAGICALLLVSFWVIINNTYRKLPMFHEDVITVGVFSDSYWEVQNGYSYQILDDAIALFEEQNPGVRVEYVSGLMKEDYPEWLSEQMLKGTVPDVFFVLGDNFNDFAEIGALKDLTSLIEEDREFLLEAFYSSAYAYGVYDGRQYALPYECAPKLMFVNKSILDAEGLEMPDGDWTWDEFYDICEKVTKDTDGNGTVDQFGTVGYTWEDAFDSNGVQLFNRLGTECYLTDSKAVDAISFIERLEKLNDGYSVSGRDFALGNVVFQPMLFSEYRAYKSYPLSIKKYSGFEWECMPMPAGPEGGNISRLDTLSIAMSSETVHTELAWKLMKLLTSNVQIQSEIFDYSEGVSVLKEVVESERTLRLLMESAGKESPLNMEVLSAAVDNAVVISRFRNYDEAVEEVDRAIWTIIDGSSNISMESIIQNRIINNYLKGNR